MRVKNRKFRIGDKVWLPGIVAGTGPRGFWCFVRAERDGAGYFASGRKLKLRK